MVQLHVKTASSRATSATWTGPVARRESGPARSEAGTHPRPAGRSDADAHTREAPPGSASIRPPDVLVQANPSRRVRRGSMPFVTWWTRARSESIAPPGYENGARYPVVLRGTMGSGGSGKAPTPDGNRPRAVSADRDHRTKPPTQRRADPRRGCRDYARYSSRGSSLGRRPLPTLARPEHTVTLGTSLGSFVSLPGGSVVRGAYSRGVQVGGGPAGALDCLTRNLTHPPRSRAGAVSRLASHARNF